MIVCCAVCNKEMDRKPSQIKRAKSQVCSSECRYELIRSRGATTPCVVCGATVRRTPAHQARNEMGICCSRECFGKLQSGSNNRAYTTGYKDKVEVACIICGTMHVKVKGRIGKRPSCSPKCKCEVMKRWPPKTSTHITKSCEVCSKEFSGSPAGMKVRKTCSLKCSNQLHSKVLSGDGNGRYVHGQCYERYPLEFRHVSEEIRVRDKGCCQWCGLLESAHHVRLHVHHIDYVKTNNTLNNLILLCASCHGTMHGTEVQRENWNTTSLNLLSSQGKLITPTT